MLDVKWISSVELVAPSDEINDGHKVPPPTIILKLNDKEYPQAFDRLKRYLSIK